MSMLSEWIKRITLRDVVKVASKGRIDLKDLPTPASAAPNLPILYNLQRSVEAAERIFGPDDTRNNQARAWVELAINALEKLQ